MGTEHVHFISTRIAQALAPDCRDK